MEEFRLESFLIATVLFSVLFNLQHYDFNARIQKADGLLVRTGYCYVFNIPLFSVVYDRHDRDISLFFTYNLSSKKGKWFVSLMFLFFMVNACRG